MVVWERRGLRLTSIFWWKVIMHQAQVKEVDTAMAKQYGLQGILQRVDSAKQLVLQGLAGNVDSAKQLVLQGLAGNVDREDQLVVQRLAEHHVQGAGGGEVHGKDQGSSTIISRLSRGRQRCKRGGGGWCCSRGRRGSSWDTRCS